MAAHAMALETLCALRETIARLEGKPSTGLQAFAGQASTVSLRPAADGVSAGPVPVTGPLAGMAALEPLFAGGLPFGHLVELRSLGLRDAGAASGFALALGVLAQQQSAEDGRAAATRLLWIGDRMAGQEAGLPHAAGLHDFGLAPHTLVHAAPRRLEDALWLAEAGLASRAFAAVIFEMRGNPKAFGLTESRRLSLKARNAGGLLLLVRQAGEEEASSALLRLLIEPAPAPARSLPDGSMLGGSIGNPVFRLTPEKSRFPALSALTLEWNVHDRLFSTVSAAAADTDVVRQAYPGGVFPKAFDRSHRPQALGTVVAFGRAS